MSDSRPSTEAAIIRLRAQGKTRDQICVELGIGSRRVTRATREFDATGLIPGPAQRGRPRKVTDAILDFIDVRTLQGARTSSAQLAGEIQAKYHVSLGRSTVAFRRKLLGFRYQPARHTQELRPHHIADRVAFCQRLLANPSWLPLTHFSDESRFVLGDDKRWVWYRKGEENDSAMHATQKFPPSVMIFAVIGPGGYKSKLLFVEGNINADKYIENLDNLGFIEELDQKHGVLGWIFQQDGAPCHTAQKAIDWLEENCDILSGWPANSPDLNPIELLWAILKHAVAREEPQTVDDLKRVLLQAWDTIGQQTIDRLCSGFVARLNLCLQVEGQSISKLLGHCREALAAKVWRADNTVSESWSPAEDEQLFTLFHRMGTQWAKIASLIPGHTPVGIKNRWYGVLAKRQQKLLQDTPTVLSIWARMRKGEGIPEVSMP